MSSFVTVRNPRTPTERELQTGFIRYEKALGATLVERFAEAWLGGKGAERVQELAREFRSTDEAILTEDAFEERHPVLAAWARWLAESADTVTWAD